ncbi:helix-turn-helix domain-containing protein [Actinoplanes lutulentus]|uniref:helix-turn-helix domain-containing protein n=1 Tax=Actinoplanes lutulentus TaxID=1287878 RepID=UPI001FE8E201|nr:helix-turn-helix domain-containing protein [Actinoplanes lutulentus]
MYDAGKYTVEEIAETFGVGRVTLYKHLNAHHDGRDCVLVVYRNTRPGKVDADTNRRYGETGQRRKCSSKQTANGSHRRAAATPGQGHRLRGQRRRHPRPGHRPQRPVGRGRPGIRRRPGHQAVD